MLDPELKYEHLVKIHGFPNDMTSYLKYLGDIHRDHLIFKEELKAESSCRLRKAKDQYLAQNKLQHEGL